MRHTPSNRSRCARRWRHRSCPHPETRAHSHYRVDYRVGSRPCPPIQVRFQASMSLRPSATLPQPCVEQLPRSPSALACPTGQGQHHAQPRQRTFWGSFDGGGLVHAPGSPERGPRRELQLLWPFQPSSAHLIAGSFSSPSNAPPHARSTSLHTNHGAAIRGHFNTPHHHHHLKVAPRPPETERLNTNSLGTVPA